MEDLFLSTSHRRKVLECGYTVVSEGVFHPDRVMHEFVLVYMLQGSMDVYVGETLYHLSRGDVFLMPPRVRHYSLTKSSDRMRNMYIHFCPIPGDLKASLDALSVPVQLHTMDSTPISSRFRDLINLFYSCHSTNRDFLLSSQIECILGLLSEYGAGGSGLFSASPLIASVLTLFTENPDRFFSQKEAAESAGISVRSLSSKFREATGTSLHAWQIDHKLSLVHDILRHDPARTLRNLAASYGFYDEFQLSRLYKKKYGFSPKSF